jgi:hypothetical protein
LTLEQIGACAAMHRKRLDPVLCGDARDGDAVAVRSIPAGTNLQCDRYVDGGNDGAQYACHQRLVLQQRRPGHDVANLFRRAPHVDVDDLCPAVPVVARRLRHHRGVGAGDLYRARLVFAAVIGAPARFVAAPEQGVRRNHLRRSHTGAELLAQLTKRTIGDARHRCEKDVTAQFVESDSHVGSFSTQLLGGGRIITRNSPSGEEATDNCFNE